MSRAIRLHEIGGPEVLKLEDVEVGAPGPGQARVRHSYVAVNFIDIYFRTGRYPMPLAQRAGQRCGGRGRGGGRGRRLTSRSATVSATCSARRARTRTCA